MSIRLLHIIPFCVVFLLLAQSSSIAQIKLGNAATQLEKSALLELSGNRQGLLLPRLTDTSIINSLNPPDGMIIYYMPNSNGKGLYIRKSGFWQRLTTDSTLSANLNSWNLTGNNGLTGTEKLGPLNNVGLNIITNNANRITITNAGVTSILGNMVLGGTLSLTPSVSATDLSALLLNGSNVVVRRTLNSAAFDGAIQNLNGLTGASQSFAVNNGITAFGFTSTGTTHTLNLPNATTALPGIVSITDQTFGGNKIFNNNITVNGTATLVSTATSTTDNNLLALNASNQVVKRNTSTLPFLQNLNGLTATTQTFAVTNNAAVIAFSTSSGTIHNLNIPDADASNRGTISTGSQTFAGAKTFNSTIIVNNLGSAGTSGLTLPKLTNATAETSGARSIGVDGSGNVVRTPTAPVYYTTGGTANITKVWIGQQANTNTPNSGTVVFNISSAAFTAVTNIQASVIKTSGTLAIDLPYATVTAISTTSITVRVVKGVSLLGGIIATTQFETDVNNTTVHLRVEGN